MLRAPTGSSGTARVGPGFPTRSALKFVPGTRSIAENPACPGAGRRHRVPYSQGLCASVRPTAVPGPRSPGLTRHCPELICSRQALVLMGVPLTLCSYRLWLWDLEEKKETPTLLPDSCLVSRAGPTIPQGLGFELLCVRIVLCSTVPRATVQTPGTPSPGPPPLLVLVLWERHWGAGRASVLQKDSSREDSLYGSPDFVPGALLIQCPLQMPGEVLFGEGCILSATGLCPQMPAVAPHHDNCNPSFPTTPAAFLLSGAGPPRWRRTLCFGKRRGAGAGSKGPLKTPCFLGDRLADCPTSRVTGTACVASGYMQRANSCGWPSWDSGQLDSDPGIDPWTIHTISWADGYFSFLSFWKNSFYWFFCLFQK